MPKAVDSNTVMGFIKSICNAGTSITGTYGARPKGHGSLSLLYFKGDVRLDGQRLVRNSHTYSASIDIQPDILVLRGLTFRDEICRELRINNIVTTRIYLPKSEFVPWFREVQQTLEAAIKAGKTEITLRNPLHRTDSLLN